MRTSASALFPCDQWLAKNEADKKASRMLDAEEQGNGTVLVSITPPGPGSLAGSAPYELPVSVGQQEGVLSVPFTSTLVRKMGGTAGQPGYRVTFNTSNVCMAGTSAPVFFELIGENGSSGWSVGWLVESVQGV